jgi:Rieske 2Fe-2S family protein
MMLASDVRHMSYSIGRDPRVTYSPTDAHLADRLQRRAPGRTLENAFYGSAEAHAFDLDRVFTRQWLFAGHTCELQKPGDFLTLQVGPYPIVVVRGKDDKIRAFHNSCRHRGSRLCPEAHGERVKLVCPYHSWTYDLDGKLLFARDMAPDFDRAAYGLHPVACADFAGYIFICLADVPPDIAPMRAWATAYLSPHHLDQAKVAHESVIIEKGDWKLVWENNRECYHCVPNHPELCRSYSSAPGLTGVVGAEDDPEITAHWAACEAAQLESRFKISADGQFRFARMPLKDGAESYTLSGKRAVRRPLSDDVSADLNIGSLMFFHYPGCWNHILGDHALSFRVLPAGPGLTQVTTKWLVHRDAVEGVDYDLEDLTRVWMATNSQDQRIVEENQFGVSSPAYRPGLYSELHEGGVVQFLDWYDGAVGAGAGAAASGA